MGKVDRERLEALALENALGLLAEDDRAELERLLAVETSAVEVLASYANVAALLAQSVPLESPAPSARQRLLRRTSASPAPAVAGISSMRADEGHWKDLPYPGVSSKNLHVDHERSIVTTLLRLAPGARYPRHRHVGVEECYVIAGDVRVGDDLVFRPGDYQRAESGSVHDVQWTETGCLLLIIASMKDQVLT